MRLLIDNLDAESEKGAEDAWRAEVARRIAELDSARGGIHVWRSRRRGAPGRAGPAPGLVES
jgi:predicted metal-dependent phosphoesterase TrpH